MGTNEISKNGNRTIKFIVIVILIIMIISLIGFAFARYVTMLNGNTQAPIAKWSFDSKILDSTQTEEISDFSVTRTDDNDDVDPNTIAPGTSGEFIIEIDATGTETLLTYETKMTLTNKPKNLKFYWDSNKAQEIVVENETYLALNGFMSLEDNKKRDISIYWDWPLETGSSPSEIEDNDVIDTTFIGKTMSMQIATTGTQVMSNPYANGVASTTINGKITVYNSVQDAIDAAGTNVGAVVTMLANEINENVEISANQNIVLDTNGKKLTSNDITILNNGICRVMGNGTIESTMTHTGSSFVIKNYEYFILDGATINSNTTRGIRNGKKLLINSGCINTTGVGIYSNSLLNEENNPAVIINNVTISAKANCISTTNCFIIIKNGIFNAIGTSETPAILNGYETGSGSIRIYNAKITANNKSAIAQYGSGSIEILDGEFEGAPVARLISGTLKLVGGTFNLKGTIQDDYAINVSDGTTLIIGTNESMPNVDMAKPTIIGKQYGIYKESRGILKFYDGIIKVPIGKTLISGSVNNTPQGYHIASGTETIDGQEYITAYLSKD